MSSWRLLRALIGFGHAVEIPVFWRELFRPPLWQAAVVRMTRAPRLMVVVGGVWCYANVLLIMAADTVLVALAPLVLLWTVLVGLTLAPVVIGEREQRTWDMLRTTPITLDALILGKASGALWWLRHLMRVMAGVLLFAAMLVGLDVLLTQHDTLYDGVGRVPGALICTAMLLLPLGIAAILIADRVQQFILMATSALAVSVASPSARAAQAWAGAATLIVWALDSSLALIVLVLQPEYHMSQTGRELLLLGTLGPVAGYLQRLPLAKAVLLAGLTLIAREVIVRLVWRWMIDTTREI